MNDLISRQAAIDALGEQIEQCDKALSSFDISMRDEFAVKAERASLVAFREILEYLPPAQPERIKGRWIEHDDGLTACECSVCHEKYNLYEEDVFGRNFCPMCGAKMEGVDDE